MLKIIICAGCLYAKTENRLEGITVPLIAARAIHFLQSTRIYFERFQRLLRNYDADTIWSSSQFTSLSVLLLMNHDQLRLRLEVSYPNIEQYT